MYFDRLIVIIFIAITSLTGCQFNLEKIEELRYRIDTLITENNQLRGYIKKQNEALSKGNETLNTCFADLEESKIELDKHKAGVAEKHDWWFKICIIFAIFSLVAALITLAIDFYLISIRKPKKQEIEEVIATIENEKSLVEKIKLDASLNQERVRKLKTEQANLTHEIEGLELHLAEKKQELETELAKQEAALQAAQEKAAAAETKLKLLNSFKK